MDSDNISPWLKGIRKSLRNNAQFEFSKMCSIAYLYQGEAGIDNITFDSYLSVFKDAPMQEYSLIFGMDSRKNSFQEMKDNSQVNLCWYFPLTKEQYKMKCQFTYLSADNITPEHEYILSDVWNRIDKENKKLFHEPHPDTLKPTDPQLSDLDKFNSQNTNTISTNLVLLVLTPFRIEHTSFAMPQVVADGRKEFESIFKPYKKNMKFLHIIQDGQWKVRELNP